MDTPLGQKYQKAYWILFLDIKRHVDLDANLDNIPLSDIPIRRGKDNERYYIWISQIHASYSSAHCEYTLWYQGKNYGAVEAITSEEASISSIAYSK